MVYQIVAGRWWLRLILIGFLCFFLMGCDEPVRHTYRLITKNGTYTYSTTDPQAGIRCYYQDGRSWVRIKNQTIVFEEYILERLD